MNANRMVVGTLRGFDQFMNLVIDNTVEVNGNERTDIGMVVGSLLFNLYIFLLIFDRYAVFVQPFQLNVVSRPSQVIRGNSVVTVEALEPVSRAQ